MKKKRYRVKGKVNDLLPEIDEYLWAYSPLQAWKIVKIRLKKRFGWWYHFSLENVEIIEI